MMGELPVGSIDHHQSRLVAASHGALRDEMGGKVIVEKIGGKCGHNLEKEGTVLATAPI